MNNPCTPCPATVPLHNESAVSTLIGVIVMVTLVVLLTVTLSAFLVGMLPAKTAYFVADAQYGVHGGYPVITLLHRAGDAARLGGSGAGYALEVRVSSGGSTTTAVPDPAGLLWSPGTTLYITRSGTGYTVTSDPARITGTPQAFPDSDLTVSITDTGGKILVYQKRITVV